MAIWPFNLESDRMLDKEDETWDRLQNVHLCDAIENDNTCTLMTDVLIALLMSGRLNFSQHTGLYEKNLSPHQIPRSLSVLCGSPDR